MKLEAKRLWLRSWSKSDLSPFYQLNSDPMVMEFLPKILSREESDQLAQKILEGFEKNPFGLFAVELKRTGEFIGFTGLSVPSFKASFTPCVEIGWRIASAHWGKGIATEAANRVLKFAFEKIGLEEVLSFTAIKNKASKRVMEKIGMDNNESDDFDHPALPNNHPLKRHLLYRINAKRWSDLENRT